uniref:Polycystic kidney disease 1 like 2a n=1 Tax=Acanthochromis polyacanthus TaxID=80966 RepID=A0A3Q1GCM7_9TELE
MKSPLPHLELHPGQQADINTLLSLVEDIIRQQNRAAGDFYTNASKKDRSMILTYFCLFAWTEDIQKKSNNSRYLYRQLRHVEKELSLLGPTRFPNPNSYSRAMQQVQGMKGLLEPSTSSLSFITWSFRCIVIVLTLLPLQVMIRHKVAPLNT